jgi:hypothetical protein
MTRVPHKFGGSLRKITATCINKDGTGLVEIVWFSSSLSWRPKSILGYLRSLGFDEIDYQSVYEFETEPFVFIEIYLFPSKDGRNYRAHDICVHSYLNEIVDDDDEALNEKTDLEVDDLRALAFFVPSCGVDNIFIPGNNEVELNQKKKDKYT